MSTNRLVQISTSILTGPAEQATLFFCDYSKGIANFVSHGDAGLARFCAGRLDDECQFPTAFIAFTPTHDCSTIQHHIWQAQARFRAQQRL